MCGQAIVGGQGIMPCADAARLEDDVWRLERERQRLRAVLEEIAQGCGHARCHAYPWIRLAQKALAAPKGAISVKE